jgi:hypothetical protein
VHSFEVAIEQIVSRKVELAAMGELALKESSEYSWSKAASKLDHGLRKLFDENCAEKI